MTQYWDSQTLLGARCTILRNKDNDPIPGKVIASCHGEGLGTDKLRTLRRGHVLLGGDAGVILLNQWLVGSSTGNLCDVLQTYITNLLRPMRSRLALCERRRIIDTGLSLINIRTPDILLRLPKRHSYKEDARA